LHKKYAHASTTTHFFISHRPIMYLLRDDIAEIARFLEEGKLICYPTDTVWAVGCDATNSEAIARLNALKGDPTPSGHVLLVSSIDMLKQFAPRVHPRIETLLTFHLRPITIIYDRSAGLPPAAKAADGSVAIRVTTDEFCVALIEAFGKPIISSIAARYDEPFPPTFGGISSEILGGVDYVVKHRQNDREMQQPSSIAKLDRHLELEFLRE
jgi:L-threonylcarbamoyladenylate synthase